MKWSEIQKRLEKAAPPEYALDWDNSGLQVGRRDREVKRVMIGLDPTTSVISQAIDFQADAIITHHPLVLFQPLTKVEDSSMLGRRILLLAEHQINLYAMHTNGDTCIMAEKAAEKIGLLHREVLEPSPINPKEGIGRVGELKTPCTLEELGKLTQKAFGLPAYRLVGDGKQPVKRVAISTGSGGSLIEAAKEAGAEVLIAGDFSHHHALDALEMGVSLMDAGHFGTEHFVTEEIEALLEPLSLTLKIAIEHSPFQEETE